MGKTDNWKQYELYNAYPVLSPLYADYEKNWSMDGSNHYFRAATPWFPVGICVAYLAMCYFGRMAMAKRKPYDLKTPLILWNFGLAIFSIIGALRVVPHIIHTLHVEGYKFTIIAPGREWCGGGAIGLWAQLFVISKVPELGDTVFIILRKKPLIFLHWYHHVTVLLYCWHSYYYEEGYGLYFAGMNYTVHAVMYMYYALAAMRIRMCQPYYVTTLQISQMFLGIAVCITCCIYYREGNTDINESNLWAAGAMYASYAFLFLQYAIRRFIKTVMGSEDKNKAKAAAKDSAHMNGNGKKAQ